jgi:hypothetical protein
MTIAFANRSFVVAPRSLPGTSRSHAPPLPPGDGVASGRSSRVAKYGGHQWRHWAHPEFARPVYYWNWAIIQRVTRIAEDSYGDQYPATETTFSGFGLVAMTAAGDDALDRCAEESGGDQSCYCDPLALLNTDAVGR